MADKNVPINRYQRTWPLLPIKLPVVSALIVSITNYKTGNSMQSIHFFFLITPTHLIYEILWQKTVGANFNKNSTDCNAVCVNICYCQRFTAGCDNMNRAALYS